MSRSTRCCGRRRAPTSSRRTSGSRSRASSTALQILLIVGPIIAYFVTKRICIGLQKKDREIALHGYESGRIVRLPGGEYIEVHEQLSDYERWKLVSFDDYKPLMLRPNKDGKITVNARLRARASSWFFEDRIAPVARTEIEASHGAHSGDEHPAVESH